MCKCHHLCWLLLIMWLSLAAITLLAPAAVSATTGQDHTLLRPNTVEQQRTPEDGLPRKLHGRFLLITGSSEKPLLRPCRPAEDIC